MIVYTHENGYGNVDADEVRKVIQDLPLPKGSISRIILLELLLDYEVLHEVVEGKGCVFRHSDGSELY